MSSCFVSNAAAAFAKRQLEKTKEKKEKKDKKSESGKESPKPCAEQQNTKAHQEEVGGWAGLVSSLEMLKVSNFFVFCLFVL